MGGAGSAYSMADSPKLADSPSVWSYTKRLFAHWWTWATFIVCGSTATWAQAYGKQMTADIATGGIVAGFVIASFMAWREEAKGRLALKAAEKKHSERLSLHFRTDHGKVTLRVVNHGDSTERIETVKLLCVQRDGKIIPMESSLIRDKGTYLLAAHANQDFQFVGNNSLKGYHVSENSMTMFNLTAFSAPNKILTHYFASVQLENTEVFQTPKIQLPPPDWNNLKKRD